MKNNYFLIIILLILIFILFFINSSRFAAPLATKPGTGGGNFNIFSNALNEQRQSEITTDTNTGGNTITTVKTTDSTSGTSSDISQGGTQSTVTDSTSGTPSDISQDGTQSTITDTTQSDIPGRISYRYNASPNTDVYIPLYAYNTENSSYDIPIAYTTEISPPYGKSVKKIITDYTNGIVTYTHYDPVGSSSTRSFDMCADGTLLSPSKVTPSSPVSDCITQNILDRRGITMDLFAKKSCEEAGYFSYFPTLSDCTRTANNKPGKKFTCYSSFKITITLPNINDKFINQDNKLYYTQYSKNKLQITQSDLKINGSTDVYMNIGGFSTITIPYNTTDSFIFYFGNNYTGLGTLVNGTNKKTNFYLSDPTSTNYNKMNVDFSNTVGDFSKSAGKLGNEISSKNIVLIIETVVYEYNDTTGFLSKVGASNNSGRLLKQDLKYYVFYNTTELYGQQVIEYKDVINARLSNRNTEVISKYNIQLQTPGYNTLCIPLGGFVLYQSIGMLATSKSVDAVVQSVSTTLYYFTYYENSKGVAQKGGNRNYNYLSFLSVQDTGCVDLSCALTYTFKDNVALQYKYQNTIDKIKGQTFMSPGFLSRIPTEPFVLSM